MKIIGVVFISILLFTSCDKKEEGSKIQNPHAEGFNIEGSDEKAINIADSVMIAMGGRKTWDSTRFVRWVFGKRELLWDKESGLVRIDFPSDSSVYLVNIKEDTGKVKIRNREISEPDTLQQLLARAKHIWINDSYWLVMPFKLKDSGVTLNYLREDTTKAGEAAHVLQLTFDSVGFTPENKYEVYIDKEDNLVKQWAYFQKASQDSASAVWPWDNYQEVAGLKLSFNRSDDRGPKDVRIYKDLPDSIFSSFATLEWDKYPDYQ